MPKKKKTIADVSGCSHANPKLSNSSFGRKHGSLAGVVLGPVFSRRLSDKLHTKSQGNNQLMNRGKKKLERTKDTPMQSCGVAWKEKGESRRRPAFLFTNTEIDTKPPTPQPQRNAFFLPRFSDAAGPTSHLHHHLSLEF